ncbi:efflux RND transporter periplasmic adaptor subunit [candidate division KSB1 bacterium]|nr:efflux RND transporter periplasmic adaptor subunit [candidate division KSB1 bacterium]
MKRFNKFWQTHHFNWYTILWLGALIIIIYLYQNWHIDKKFIGIVERRTHSIGVQEPGRIQNIMITVGEQVKKDQILAILDISDLKQILNQLQKELSNIQDTKSARQNRSSIFVQRMALELDNEASRLVDRLSLIESKSTELAGLNAEIERLKNAEAAGLGHSRDLADLILQRDALASYLREQSKDLEFQSQKLEKTRASRKLFEDANLDSMTRSLIYEQMEYAESLQRQIGETENRIRLRTIIAPCDGYVTEIFAHAGDVVDAFIPVLSIEETQSVYVNVFIPEKSTLLPEPGMKVELMSSRSREFNTTGVITFVHPGFTQAADRLSFRGQIFWARKARVEIPINHHLVPGEVVYAHIIKDAAQDSHFASSAVASDESLKKPADSGAKHPPVKNMAVPADLYKKTRFEPSGITWLPQVGKYLIVSDDTGIPEATNDHAPYLFMMDETGTVESAPVTLNGINAINDLEAISRGENGIYYLVSSQNISKKGKRPGSREFIIKVAQEGEKFSTVEQVEFLSLLLQSYTWSELNALGLQKFEADGQPVLNIEGAAYLNQALYFGLKEPVTDKGAIIWKLENVDEIFKNQKLISGQLSLYGYVDLGGFNKQFASISDLTFDDNGILWALSTIADADDDEQMGGFHRINRFADGRLEAVRLFNFPGLKPEGLCFQDARHLMIVFDRDKEIPAFCLVDAEEL